ncbi:RNA polymerase sigma factor [Pararobbsia silviterrae]|uniref:RNA polymerase sigma factor n=1 Tax=Pararobbsia silviterrae TaxID=1792498 RepID=A0A494Y5Q5_9BURK|nr:RNA polymerase sigma factor [Pararobbsia silviterrae]RKP55901.1 RNA polymerase sigma factor [Pararobbsia silviterrae]
MTRDELPALLPELLPRIWAFALRLAADRHDAEDLVQRACVRALERRHQWQPGTSALSWLFSIVHSIWIDEIRARQIRGRARVEWNEALVETVADPAATDPLADLLYKQVIAAVDALPDAQRVVMLLVAVEGLSYREAAEVLEIPIGTVMSRLSRARLTIGAQFSTPTPHADADRGARKDAHP